MSGGAKKRGTRLPVEPRGLCTANATQAGVGTRPCFHMSAALRLQALGAGSNWHRAHHPCTAIHGSLASRRPELPSALVQSPLAGSLCRGGGSSRKLAVRPTGGSAPEAPCRARCNAPASEGGACCRLSPPKGDSDDLEAAISFLLRTRLRGHFQPLFFSRKVTYQGKNAQEPGLAKHRSGRARSSRRAKPGSCAFFS